MKWNHPRTQSLHWLPVSKWIEYKIPCLTYQWVFNTMLQYLQKLVSQYNPPCSLCSSSLCRLSVSGFGKDTNEKRSGARSFHNAAPTLWNRLPDKINQTKDIASFWQHFVIFLILPPHPLSHAFPPLINLTPRLPSFQSSLPSAKSLWFSACLVS